MAYTLKELADFISDKSGLNVEIVGDAGTKVVKVGTIDSASNNEISFLANAKYKKHLQQCDAGAMILAKSELDAWSKPALVMDNPYVGFALVAQYLDTTPAIATNVAPSAVIDEAATVAQSAKIGANVVIEAGAVVGEEAQIGAGSYIGQGTIVGNGTKVWPNVTLYHGVEIGKECIIHSNTVIGSDGFGYAPLPKDGDQHWIKIPQMGRVIIGDNTEIGASVTIDRGALENTVIGKGVIIDNQVHIAHNVEIGDYTAMAGASGVAGSSKIGKNVTIGGQVAINGHISICDKAFITGRTFVIKDITEPGVYSSGMPAATNREWRNNTARYRKLTELFDRVKKLEAKK